MTWRVLRRQLDPQNLTSFVLIVFSATAFVGFMGLMIARELHSGKTAAQVAMQMSVFGTTPRYVVPLHFLFLGFAVSAGIVLARAIGPRSYVLFYLVAAAAALAQVGFQRNGYKAVAPLWNISHQSAWRLAVATVRECRAAGLAVPQVPLDSLTQEFSQLLDFRAFEPLVRSDSQLQPSETIVYTAWDRGMSSASGYRQISSLRLLEQKLRLLRPEQEDAR